MNVTVVTSLYRSAPFLKRYMKQISNFHKKISKLGIMIEYLIIANDITREEKIILERFEQENFRIICVPRESLYASWNRGVKESNSDIIAFWNVDDIRFPGALYKGYKAITDGSEIVYFPFYVFGLTSVTAFKKRLSFPFLKVWITRAIPFDRGLFMKGCMCGPFFMFNKDLFNKIGPFDDSLIVAGDFEWFARAAFMNTVFLRIRTIGGIFFTHYGNLTVTNSRAQAEENERVLNKYYYSGNGGMAI